MTLISATILLFLVMDPFGNIPLFSCILSRVAPARRQRVLLRELLIALLVLIVFLMLGPTLLALMQLSQAALGIAGAIILFLIAIRMVFLAPDDVFAATPEGDPLVVPLAIPSIAGPSAISVVMLLTAQQPEAWLVWLAALTIAWAMAGVVLMLSVRLGDMLGDQGVIALQRLMGLILTTIAVEMLLQGIKGAFEI